MPRKTKKYKVFSNGFQLSVAKPITYPLNWNCKLATVTSQKTDVSSVSPSKHQLFNLLPRPIYNFNLVDITKLPSYPHRRSTKVSLETSTLYLPIKLLYSANLKLLVVEVKPKQSNWLSTFNIQLKTALLVLCI